METFTAMETLLKVRVATTDMELWKLAAEREGMKLSEWVRAMLDRAIKAEWVCATLDQATKQEPTNADLLAGF